MVFIPHASSHDHHHYSIYFSEHQVLFNQVLRSDISTERWIFTLVTCLVTFCLTPLLIGHWPQCWPLIGWWGIMWHVPSVEAGPWLTGVISSQLTPGSLSLTGVCSAARRLCWGSYQGRTMYRGSLTLTLFNCENTILKTLRGKMTRGGIQEKTSYHWWAIDLKLYNRDEKQCS